MEPKAVKIVKNTLYGTFGKIALQSGSFALSAGPKELLHGDITVYCLNHHIPTYDITYSTHIGFPTHIYVKLGTRKPMLFENMKQAFKYFTSKKALKATKPKKI